MCGKQFYLLGLKILDSSNDLLIGKALILLAKFYVEVHIDWFTRKENNHLKALRKIFKEILSFHLGNCFYVISSKSNSHKPTT